MLNDFGEIVEETPSFKIAIPSYGRSMLLKEKTLKFLKQEGISDYIIYVFIVEEEIELYRESIPEFKGHWIIGEKGVVNQRNFIIRYFAEGERILSLDDDVGSWDRSLSFRHRGSTLQEFVEYAFDYALQNQSFIWSVYPVFNPFYRDSLPEFIFCNCYLIGAFYGFINRKSMEMSCSIQYIEEKEDVYRSINYFDRDGIVVRFDRIGFETKYYNKVGGLGTLEMRKWKSEQVVRALVRKFPHAGVSRKRNNDVWEFRFFPNAPCNLLIVPIFSSFSTS